MRPLTWRTPLDRMTKASPSTAHSTRKLFSLLRPMLLSAEAGLSSD
jgi:hypothetical protein